MNWTVVDFMLDGAGFCLAITGIAATIVVIFGA